MSAGKAKRQARDVATALNIRYVHAFRLLREGLVVIEDDGTITDKRISGKGKK